MSMYRIKFTFTLPGMTPAEFAEWCTEMLDALHDNNVIDPDMLITYIHQRVIFDFIIPGTVPFDALAHAIPTIHHALGRAGYVDVFPDIAEPVVCTR